MTLVELIATSRVDSDEVRGNAEVIGVSDDSRGDCGGKLFICMPSASGDSHRFIRAAADRGATAAMVHSREGLGIAASLPAVLVEDRGVRFAEAVGRICKVAFHDPSSELRLVGITGTNGKTTTAWLIRDMLVSRGVQAGYLGTLGFQTPFCQRTLENTTPFSPELNALLNEARAERVETLAIEVSSHALEERRIDGIEFDAAVFTNLTQDHMDYHGDMASYERAKFRLFTDLPAAARKRFVGAINVDDPVGLRWMDSLPETTISFGQKRGELRGLPVHIGLDRIRMRLRFSGDEAEFESAIGGSYNVENCLSAAAGFLALGYSLSDAADALHHVRPVPGRFEAVPNRADIGVIVDYAHTPDAVEKLLDAVSALEHRRIVAVFGCGGDRDRSKRPKMAHAVSLRADVTIVTSDNPRTEDPATILEEVAAGVVKGKRSIKIVDRREAIAEAIRLAEPGDVVVIAGKGHENYQIVGRTKYPMDDRQIAREALEARA